LQGLATRGSPIRARPASPWHDPTVSVTADHDMIAEPRECVRCARRSLLSVSNRCADCIAELQLQDDPAEYQAWKADVRAEFGRK
jgi:hypothetical protein